jgi:hypothetical protein
MLFVVQGQLMLFVVQGQLMLPLHKHRA